MLKKTKIKISNISNKKEPFSKFAVSYSTKKRENSQISYEIVSSLKGENDIIIEINSSFLNFSEKESKEFLPRLLEELDNYQIKYKKRKILANNRKTILSVTVKNETVEGFELFAIIPNEIWKDDRFRKIIPKIGVRYYLPKTQSDINLDELIDLDESQKISLFKMVIFDYVLLGSMGINTSEMNKEAIEALIYKT